MTSLALKGKDARIIKMSEKLPKNTIDTPTKLFIALSDRTVSIRSTDILFCKSNSNYTHFFLKDKTTILASKSLKHFQAILGNSLFVRCHASYLVNKDEILCIMKNNSLLQITSHWIPISKSRKKSVKSILQN